MKCEVARDGPLTLPSVAWGRKGRLRAPPNKSTLSSTHWSCFEELDRGVFVLQSSGSNRGSLVCVCKAFRRWKAHHTSLFAKAPHRYRRRGCKTELFLLAPRLKPLFSFGEALGVQFAVWSLFSLVRFNTSLWWRDPLCLCWSSRLSSLYHTITAPHCGEPPGFQKVFSRVVFHKSGGFHHSWHMSLILWRWVTNLGSWWSHQDW